MTAFQNQALALLTKLVEQQAETNELLGHLLEVSRSSYDCATEINSALSAPDQPADEDVTPYLAVISDNIAALVRASS